jgi:hypothetical protein
MRSDESVYGAMKGTGSNFRVGNREAGSRDQGGKEGTGSTQRAGSNLRVGYREQGAGTMQQGGETGSRQHGAGSRQQEA